MVGVTDGGPNASWSDTPPLDFAACRLRFPRVAMELAVIPLRSSVGESETCSSEREFAHLKRIQKTPARSALATRLRCHGGCFRPGTQHILWMTLRTFIPTARAPRDPSLE